MSEELTHLSDPTTSDAALVHYFFQRLPGLDPFVFRLLASRDGARARVFLIHCPFSEPGDPRPFGATVGECGLSPTGCLHFDLQHGPESLETSEHDAQFCIVNAGRFALRLCDWAETGRFEVPQDWPGSPAMLAHLTATEAK